MKHVIAQDLIRRFNGQIKPFAQLPREAQLAMAHYMAIDGEAWKPSKRFQNLPHATGTRWKRLFVADLPHYVATYGKKRFGLVRVPMTDLLQAIWLSFPKDVRQDFASFHVYHEWYGRNFDVPDHGPSRWPVILASDHDEEQALQDGWHRLHDYYRNRAKIVPCLYYP